MIAGYTLNNKNPSNAPTTAHVIGSIPLFVPTATTVKNVATRTVTLEARLSEDYPNLVSDTWIRSDWIFRRLSESCYETF